MVSPIPTSVKKLWDTWNLRGFILLSLTVQTILILCAPFRKRTPNMVLTFLVWSAYLLADWAANFAIGLIANSQDDSGTPELSQNASDLLAFWAPFLLLHLGGPDTITAFALEDNTLWLRHLLGLIFQVIAAVYVFIQSFPTNKLWFPTSLLFVAGIIKYAERTRALYLASLNNFKESMLGKPDAGPNYAKLMEEYSSKLSADLPSYIELAPERSQESRKVVYEVKPEDMKNDIAVVQHAYHFFETFKGLIVDLIFSFRERYESRVIFHQRTSREAFDLIAVELNFIYEALFTKAVVVHSNLGYLFRVISVCAVCVALVFFKKLDKQDFHDIDVGITYALLCGAIGLESIALFMVVFSDWTVAALNKSWENFGITRYFLGGYIKLKRSRWPTTEKLTGSQKRGTNPKRRPATSTFTGNEKQDTNATSCLERTRQILLRRWYESFSIFNLIDYSLKERRKPNPTVYDRFGNGFLNTIKFFGLKDLLDKMRYKTSKPLSEDLWDFIYKELKSKSMLAEDTETAKQVGSARGDWVLHDNDWDSPEVITKLLPYVVDVEFDQNILLWHIATELCYNIDKKTDTDNDGGEKQKTKEYSKALSDYMLYLLVMQPALVSSIAGIGQIRFRDTCEEAKRFFSGMEFKVGSGLKDACKRLMEVNTAVKPQYVKGDRSKSVLFDACMLANELKNLEEKKWDVMSRVWVELLSFAAGHCRPNEHAQLLSKGGELVTFVWFLMAHFGIGEQFQINEGHARAKLIVNK